MYPRRPRAEARTVKELIAPHVRDPEILAWAEAMGDDFVRAWETCPHEGWLFAIHATIASRCDPATAAEQVERSDRILGIDSAAMRAGRGRGPPSPADRMVEPSREWMGIAPTTPRPATSSGERMAALRAAVDIAQLLEDAGLRSR